MRRVSEAEKMSRSKDLSKITENNTDLRQARILVPVKEGITWGDQPITSSRFADRSINSANSSLGS